MLNCLRGKASDRKLRLFCLAVWNLWPGAGWPGAEHKAQKYAEAAAFIDGELSREDIRARGGNDSWDIYRQSPAKTARIRAVSPAPEHVLPGLSAADKAAMLRCLFGNPFRPATLDPAWLSADSRMVPRLAGAIYSGHSFERLAVLADALEEVGCTDAELIGHLRGPGPHVRGCWALDLLLGHEDAGS
jgi:hypothetical protein